MPAKKKPAKNKGVSTGDSLQALHDAVVNAEVVGHGNVVCGRTLRPVTLETIILLKQINSPLILGMAMEEIENVFLDCCKFVVLQSSEKQEARALAWDMEKLTQAALDFASEVKANELESLTTTINGILMESTKTAVEAKPPKGGTSNDPLGN